MTRHRTRLICAMALLTASSEAEASCYADPKRLAAAMATVVASYKCPGYRRALFGTPLDVFVRKAQFIDQTTGACERERTLAMNAATEQMLADRNVFCAEVEAALASDSTLAQALVEAGARKAP